MKLIKTIAIFAATLASPAFSAPPDKVGVCHFSKDDGTFRLITIAAPAVNAHLAHGDALAPAAGATVPVIVAGVAVNLDSNCAVVPAA